MKHVGTRVNAKDVASQEQLIDIVASQIHATADKSTPANADEFGIADSAASWGLKKLTWANIKAALASLFVSNSGGTVAGNLTVQGSLMTTAGPLGYGPGAGGSVTQATNKTTGVTLNKSSGRITMNNSALSAGTETGFALTNSFITGNSTISVTPYGANGNNYRVRTNVAPGVCSVFVKNETENTLSDALILQFNVLQGSSS
ncbi:hypothetical protein [Acidovorax sp. MR-S7]|uniref:hypothetical protein n=1 Tax=Acidovorax sp. MR-S7 TaxID=1268622 RepID=UPI0003A7F9F0|nr:hypothetical protein [Acidovorax sp. MR-S7]GAD20972.1 hypothetical protein AVS7_00733 [Acidovorax sp. MR-S7]